MAWKPGSQLVLAAVKRVLRGSSGFNVVLACVAGALYFSRGKVGGILGLKSVPCVFDTLARRRACCVAHDPVTKTEMISLGFLFLLPLP